MLAVLPTSCVKSTLRLGDWKRSEKQNGAEISSCPWKLSSTKSAPAGVLAVKYSVVLMERSLKVLRCTAL